MKMKMVIKMQIKKRLVLLFLFTCFMIMGCNNQASNQNSPSEKETGPIKTSLEDMLKEGPGSYAGEGKYQKEQFEQEVLSKFPKDLDGKEVYQRLLSYFAEGGYQKEIETMNSVEPIYSLHENRPTDGTSSKTKPVTKKVNVQILLDASGSMAGKIDGRSKMDLAKEAVDSFAGKLDKNTQVSLRVYGHKGSGKSKDKQVSCNTTEVIYQNAKYEATSFKMAIGKVQPAGWTPLAKAILDAKADLQKSTNTVNVIYVVSDGIESCGGNPVQAAKDIHQSNVQTVVNIIGLDIKEKEKEALKEISDAGGGKYIEAKSSDDLKRELQTANAELWLKWSTWDTSNQAYLLNQWSKKYTIVEKAYSTALKKILREHAREISSILYLNSKGILVGKTYIEVSDLISKRYQMISGKIGDTNTKKNKQLEDTRELLEQKVSDEANEMKQNYKN
jgi:D-amino-acid dehydrogenase/Ca-activated chloride channel family protein